MSIRKRPTRAGQRRMKETGCKVADLPSQEITWLVDYKDRAGARRFATFPTQREAKNWLATTLHEVKEGRHVAPSTMPTVAEAAAAWIARGEADQRERSTIKQRRQHVDYHILPLLGGDTKLSKIDVDWFRDELLRTRSRPMAKKVMTSLKAILKQHRVAHLAAHVEKIETGGRHKKRLEVGRDIPLPDEIKALWPHASGYARALLAVAVFCGLRMSEIRALRWQDLDLGDKPRLHVRQRADRWNMVGVLKSETSYRSIPLIPFAVNTLKEWKLACPRLGVKRDKDGKVTNPGELVLMFPNGAGNVESLGNIWNRRLGPVQLKAGVTVPKLDQEGKPVLDKNGEPVMRGKYGPHAFRHFFASWRIAQGDNIKRVSVLMGHSSPVVTLSIYSHLLPDEDEHEKFAAGAAALVA